MEWTGPSMKRAQAERDETLERLFSDIHGYVPTLIFPRGSDRIGVVMQDHNGYYDYRIYRAGVPGSLTSGLWTRAEAERSCRRHLAQDVFSIGLNGQIANDGMDVIAADDEEGRGDHRAWVIFQVQHVLAQVPA